MKDSCVAPLTPRRTVSATRSESGVPVLAEAATTVQSNWSAGLPFAIAYGAIKVVEKAIDFVRRSHDSAESPAEVTPAWFTTQQILARIDEAAKANHKLANAMTEQSKQLVQVVESMQGLTVELGNLTDRVDQCPFHKDKEEAA